MTTEAKRECGCLASDPVECLDLRTHSYYPAQDLDVEQEACGCYCHLDDEVLYGTETGDEDE